jgi:hypothetical protein
MLEGVCKVRVSKGSKKALLVSQYLSDYSGRFSGRYITVHNYSFKQRALILLSIFLSYISQLIGSHELF